MSDSDHTAIGQALGYLYQFDRAIYRLLESDNLVISVGIEHVDDVSVHRADGTSIREQDKATTGDGGQLVDRSVALWKTIAIWAEAVLAGPEMLNSTEFHLVTNGRVRPGSLAARIHEANTDTDTLLMATELLSMSDGLREDLQPYAHKIRRLPPALLAILIGRIYVFDSVSSAFGGSLDNLPVFRLLGELQRIAIYDQAHGWVRRKVLTAAKNSEPTLIDREGFNKELKALFRRVAVAPLAVIFETLESADPVNYRSCGFFQQLDWIDTEPEFVRDCVIHYVQARAARIKWTDTDAVSEASLLAYEEDLRARWRLQQRRQSHRTYQSLVQQGQELLTETLSEETVLDGQPMPKAITCGNFHALADFDARTDPKIGWHPDYEKMAQDSKDSP